MTGKLRKVPGQEGARQAYTYACQALSLWPNIPRSILSKLALVAGNVDRELRDSAAKPPAEMVVVRCLTCEESEAEGAAYHYSENDHG